MKTTIERYAVGADNRDIKALEQVFHENFKVNAITKSGLKSMDKKTYLDLMKAGKIGGSKRKVTIVSIHEDGPIGTAKVTLEGEKAVFHDNMTLINEGGDWRIIANVTRVQVK